MDYGIVYSSQTGNTEMLARAIKEVLPAESCLYYGKPDGQYVDAPMVFVGFWADKGFGDGVSTDFIKTLKNKKVFLFGTAGFGGSQEYYDKILNNVLQNLDVSNKIIGTFMCQGKIPIIARQYYEKKLAAAPGDEKLENLIENFDRALSHPDQTDCDNVKELAIKATSNS